MSKEYEESMRQLHEANERVYQAKMRRLESADRALKQLLWVGIITAVVAGLWMVGGAVWLIFFY